MMASHHNKSRPRRWIVPHALLREPFETLEAIHILEEIPGDLGVLLWRLHRHVTLWKSIPPNKRVGLFAPDASAHLTAQLHTTPIDGSVAVAVKLLISVTAAPETIRSGVVALACREVATWAEGERVRLTATTFAQAAALCEPRRADYALAVARAASEAGSIVRAESWFARAVGLARRSCDHRTYTQAHLDIGRLALEGRDTERAERAFRSAARMARYHALRPERAAAWHALMDTALASNRYEDAVTFGKRASRIYSPRHAELPPVLFGLGQALLGLERPGEALLLLKQAGELWEEPTDRLKTLALLACAAADAGEEAVGEDAWRQAAALLDRVPDGVAADALRLLMRAALAAGNPSRAMSVAERAFRLTHRLHSPERGAAAPQPQALSRTC